MVQTSTISGVLKGVSGSALTGRLTVALTDTFISADNYKVIPGSLSVDSENGMFTLQLVPNAHTDTSYIVTYDPTPTDRTPLRFKSGVFTRSVKVPGNDITLEDLLR